VREITERKKNEAAIKQLNADLENRVDERTVQLSRAMHHASTPIIALSALVMPGDRERSLEAGANEFLCKPINLKKLSSAVSRLLAG
jgi:CheY-like chemotaxis protein